MREIFKRIRAIYVILFYGVPKVPKIIVPKHGKLLLEHTTISNLSIELLPRSTDDYIPNISNNLFKAQDKAYQKMYPGTAYVIVR